MNYIVLDLEWNQSPNGKEDRVDHLPFEIVEIGAVKLDANFRQIGEFHRLVKPLVYTQLHYKILEVTHLNEAELQKKGKIFPQVMEEFLSWCGEKYAFCTWGSMDLTELQRNMEYHQIEIPFAHPLLYYDVQKLHWLEYGQGRNRLSLDQAVEELHIAVDQPFHRALFDAAYTGRVLAALDFARLSDYISVDYFRLPRNRREELYLQFPSYGKFVSMPFENRESALADKVVTDMICPFCGRMLRKKIRWFSWGQKLCYGLAVCPEHGTMRGKLRIKKSEYGDTYIVRTIKPATEEEAQLITDKREEGRKKRNERNHEKRKKK